MKSWIQDHDIKLLRVFYEVAKSGGFTQAQVELNLSQSSISTYMSQLETRIGMNLCTRGQSGFSLTDEGQVVLHEITKLFNALDDFAVNIADTKTDLFGTLNFGIIESSVTHPNRLIVAALTEFREQASKVSIGIYTGGALELENRVLDGRLHAAVGLFPHEVEGLKYFPLFEERHFLYCANNHPMYEIPDKDLTLYVAAKYDYASRDYVDLVKGLEPPNMFNNIATAPHMEGLMYLILTGQYFAYLPDHVAERWVARKLLRKLNIPETERSAQFHLILRKGRKQPRMLEEFLAILGAK